MKKMLELELSKLDTDVKEIVIELLMMMEKDNVDDDVIASKLRGLTNQKVKEASDATN